MQKRTVQGAMTTARHRACIQNDDILQPAHLESPQYNGPLLQVWQLRQAHWQPRHIRTAQDTQLLQCHQLTHLLWQELQAAQVVDSQQL